MTKEEMINKIHYEIFWNTYDSYADRDEVYPIRIGDIIELIKQKLTFEEFFKVENRKLLEKAIFRLIELWGDARYDIKDKEKKCIIYCYNLIFNK